MKIWWIFDVFHPGWEIETEIDRKWIPATLLEGKAGLGWDFFLKFLLCASHFLLCTFFRWSSQTENEQNITDFWMKEKGSWVPAQDLKFSLLGYHWGWRVKKWSVFLAARWERICSSWESNPGVDYSAFLHPHLVNKFPFSCSLFCKYLGLERVRSPSLCLKTQPLNFSPGRL